jgi:hypothetical protein
MPATTKAKCRCTRPVGRATCTWFARLPTRSFVSLSPAVVKGFLREGDVDVNARDHKGRVPLHKASKKGHLHVVRALLAAHAQVNVKDMKQKSPLHLAAFWSHREVFKVLLRTAYPLHHACSNGRLHHVERFLRERDVDGKRESVCASPRTRTHPPPPPHHHPRRMKMMMMSS